MMEWRHQILQEPADDLSGRMETLLAMHEERSLEPVRVGQSVYAGRRYTGTWRTRFMRGSLVVDVEPAATWATDVTVGVGAPKGLARSLWVRAVRERVAKRVTEDVVEALKAVPERVPARHETRPFAVAAR